MRNAVDRREVAADEDRSVLLHGETLDDIVAVGSEKAVERTVRIEPHEPVARRAVDAREITSDENFSISLERKTPHAWRRRTREVGAEKSVLRPIGIDSRQRTMADA